MQNGANVSSDTVPKSPRTPGQEETLEWYEVIELQAFSERKAWIEEKTQFLEQLPPIQVFVGLDAIRESALEVPGLPTREQLQDWLEEHDRIEKETEIFDRGELQKLKKFTKAAASRNLSPVDTDLIELTLTTIYALDKLIHLLRDRSDNLELLGVRLTWEEKRRAAWTEVQSLTAELQQFLETRARWTPCVYERDEQDELESPVAPANERLMLPLPQPAVRRRGSVVSLASATSDTIAPTLGLSRHERFRIAEILSRDAALFASRVSSLRHSKIAAAGKALDKLIGESRRPVPDELLDEQDRLENKGINEMEGVGKFVMHVVSQWKKADDIYVETLKDKNAAQTLLEEIEMAKLRHPVGRQDVLFAGRLAALVKRLEMRGNPANLSSPFPRPKHPLFLDQEAANFEIARVLGEEIETAQYHVKEADTVAKDYHVMSEAVKKVNSLCRSASTRTSEFQSLIARLTKGVDSREQDGLPPSLDNETCLQKPSHAGFLARLPDVVERVNELEAESGDLLLEAERALSALRFPNINEDFREESTDTVDELVAARNSAVAARDATLAQVDALGRVQRVWTTMATIFDRLNNLREDIAESIKRHAWESDTEDDAALLTPESPASVLPSADPTPPEVSESLDQLASMLGDDVMSPLGVVGSSLGPPLREYLYNCASGLGTALEDARRMAVASTAIQKQSSEMMAVRDETNILQVRMEEFKARCESEAERLLTGALDGDGGKAVLTALYPDASQLRSDAQSVQDSLPHRIPFVSTSDKAIAVQSIPPHQKHFSVSSGLSLDLVRQAAFAGLPIDLLALDRTVRADCNRYSILLAGGVEGLSQAINHFKVCEVARRIDLQVSSLSTSLRHASDNTKTLQQSVNEAPEMGLSYDKLAALSEQLDKISETHRPDITSISISLRDLVSQLDAGLTGLDHASGNALVLSRKRAGEEAQQRAGSWKESVEILSERITDLRRREQVRLAEERAREEAESLRLEAKARAEQERLEAERRIAEEQARTQAAEEKRLRLEDAAREHERLAVEAAEAERRRIAEPRVPSLDEGALVHDSLASPRLYARSSDVFGMDGLPNAGSTLATEFSDLRSLVTSLRQQLRAINISEVGQPDGRGAISLPTEEEASKLERSVTALLDDANTLPESVPGSAAVEANLQSLRSEILVASDLLRRIHQLAGLAASVRRCDDALSDLLEHVDSFPAPPTGPLSSSHNSDTNLAPEDQMLARLSFTQTLVDDAISRGSELSGDARAITERERISQTWDELRAMAMDRLAEPKSRPPSAVGNGRTSRNAATPNPVPGPPKRPSAGRHSMSTSTPKFLAPPLPKAGRSISGTSTGSTHSRSSSRASGTSTSRSVSGPIPITIINPTSRLYTSTFASRQRSSSIASDDPTTAEKQRSTFTLPSNPPSIMPRPRSGTNQSMPRRTASPALSEMSRSRSSLSMSRSSVGSTTKSSWSRAPRHSFPHVPNSPSGPTPPVKEKKPYVANPKNKLDVALGDVVNNLPVSINVEVVADTWKDQSGKYWIGDEDPKLCFCRILRSQTVMVRVGGGWAELSKFIREHFADAFRLVPDSPRRGSTEEKWISSTILQQQSIQEVLSTPPSHPQTPEPKNPIPSFALSTPPRASPKSLKSSSPGSPLQPIEFIRRADRDSPLLRADTPTKLLRPRSISHTSRPPAWRP
ncbi:uncharacterized protein PHACADRAFT_88087 [Phanerochaete carnosa HHB-10118-sp]|uniref:GAR domain-containing protein n=1 Tax=Phanerochaete carnosa (strain HHB-10118-sp) TaxID=650164 RepID=K5W6Q6_PHACS|nr:uncharacterized protein PHACADRAFT_88087 [Phanerochaete carnosa HHB-10118-sp]EKM59623.1 hypothetical protein PHACADRAFT_88087 [Phanerochaete carnosa HHB-10118-sp]